MEKLDSVIQLAKQLLGAVQDLKPKTMHHYIVPIIGKGTEEDPYRASIADMKLLNGASIPYVSVIPSNEDGTPKNTWCLVKTYEVVSDPNFIELPNEVTTDKIASFVVDAKNSFNTFPILDVATSDIVEAVGKHLTPNFDSKDFYLKP